jgi:hypothetical protein
MDGEARKSGMCRISHDTTDKLNYKARCGEVTTTTMSHAIVHSTLVADRILRETLWLWLTTQVLLDNSILSTDTELPGRPSHPAVRATLNTNTTTEHEAIEPRTIAIITTFSGVGLYRPLLIYIAI